MATKRMFSNSVIDADSFCLLSIEAQLLYFHLGMKADDDGFVPVMKICKILGFDENPLRELENAGFIIRDQSGVVVIVHWGVNNTLKKDRYHESRYTSFKKRLRVNENNEYFIPEPEWNQDGTEPEQSIAQVSPGEVSPGEVSPAQVSPGEGSPEGRGELQPLLEEASSRGVRVNQAVIRILQEEKDKGLSTDELIRMMKTRPSFLQRLKLVGGTA